MQAVRVVIIGLVIGLMISAVLVVPFRFRPDSKSLVVSIVRVLYVFGSLGLGVVLADYLGHRGVLGEWTEGRRFWFMLLWLAPVTTTLAASMRATYLRRRAR